MSARLAPLFTWRSAIVDSELAATTRHVALTLSLHMNERGGSCYPGAPRLARETGLSERAVRDHLGRLVDAGWLVLERRGGQRGGRRESNEYRATVPDETATPAAGSGVEDRTGVSAGGCTRDRGSGVTPAGGSGVPLQETAPTPAAGSPQYSKSTSPPPGDLWSETLDALVAREWGGTDQTRVGNPGAWRVSVRERLAVEHVDRFAALTRDHPSASPSQLADLLAGSRIPLERVCPAGCRSGWIEDEGGDLVRCPLHGRVTA